MAATALLGLWRVRFSALRRSLDGEGTPEQVRDAVTAGVRSAARLLDAAPAGFDDTTMP